MWILGILVRLKCPTCIWKTLLSLTYLGSLVHLRNMVVTPLFVAVVALSSVCSWTVWPQRSVASRTTATSCERFHVDYKYMLYQRPHTSHSLKQYPAHVALRVTYTTERCPRCRRTFIDDCTDDEDDSIDCVVRVVTAESVSLYLLLTASTRSTSYMQHVGCRTTSVTRRARH